MAVSTRANRPIWPWIVGLVAALLLGIGIGAAAVRSVKISAIPKPAGTVTLAPTTVVVSASPTSTIPAPVQAAAQEPVVAETTKAGPKTEFSDGTYLVGTDIQAGSYKSSGPGAGESQCYWKRSKGDGGQNTIANDLTKGPTRFTANKGEYVKIDGCTFTKA